MNIQDVKVGDRCWAASSAKCDEHGQNVTVSATDGNRITLRFDGEGERAAWGWTPGIDVFWRKPEAPPKPKRKVTKTFTGWMTEKGLEILGTDSGAQRWPKSVNLWNLSDPDAVYFVTITVEVEE